MKMARCKIHPHAPHASSYCMLYLGGQWGGLAMGVARDGGQLR
jgi:hypothetical protein